MHKRRSLPAVSLAQVLVISLLLAACGGGGSSGGGGGQAASLESITIGPSNLEIPWGFTLQLTATGHYSDNTTQNLTDLAQWTSSDVAVATVGDAAGNKGLLEGIATGDAEIAAAFEEVSASRIAQIVDPVITQIVVAPSSVHMAVGATEAFTCTVFYLGGYSRDATDDATWSSSDANVATISNGSGTEGIATAVATGQCEIAAAFDLFADQADLTVIEVEVLDSSVASAKQTVAPRCAVDGAGAILAVWSYEGLDPGELYWRRYEPGAGWNSKQPVATRLGTALEPVVAGNDAGVRFVAWTSEDELWVARYDETNGWGAPIEIASGDTADRYAVDVVLAVFGNGDALVVWRTALDDQLRTKTYVEGTGWGVTSVVGAVGTSLHPIALAANAAGEAQLLWQDANAGIWQLHGSRYTVATGFEPPFLLHSSTVYHQPAVAIDSVGNALAAWIDFTPFPDSHLLAARYVAGIGWETPELVNDLDVPREPAIGLDDAGDAFALWRHAIVGGTGLSGSRFVPGTGWEERAPLKSSPGGAPEPLPPHLDGLGGIVAHWATNSPADGVRLEIARYVPGTGWSPAESFDFIGAEAPTIDLQLAVHASGASIVTWGEAQAAGDVLFSHRF